MSEDNNKRSMITELNSDIPQRKKAAKTLYKKGGHKCEAILLCFGCGDSICFFCSRESNEDKNNSNFRPKCLNCLSETND